MSDLYFLKSTLAGSYDLIADDFSNTRGRGWGEFELLRKLLDDYKLQLNSVGAFSANIKILDLGCGNGRAIPFLSANGENVCGFDSSASLLNIARSTYPHIDFNQGKMQDVLPYQSRSFHEVWSIASFHHLVNQRERFRALGEIHRVLKKEGFLVMTVWNLLQSKYDVLKNEAIIRGLLLPHWGFDDLVIPFGKEKIPRFYHAFNLKELQTLLEDNFFSVEDIFLSKGSQKVDDSETAHNLCVIARKESRTRVCNVPFDLIAKSDVINQMNEYAQDTKTNHFIRTDNQNIADKFLNKKQIIITTPNPEMCVEAYSNHIFRDVLDNADLSLADGSGIIWASNNRSSWIVTAFISLIKFLFSSKKIGVFERIQGSDVFRMFCEQTDKKVFLLGGVPGIAERCAGEIAKINHRFYLAGTDAGSAQAHDDERICNKINQSGAEVLFVAFGAPNQELWIKRNLSKLPRIRFAMGIGGSFDFVAGVRKRAPKIVRSLGLEWLWRLLIEPKRIRRIWTATYIFIKLVIKNNRSDSDME